MTKISDYMLQSVRAAICRERLSAPEEDFLWEDYYKWCKKNSIANVVSYALAEISDQLPKEIRKKFHEEQAKGIFVDMKQHAETERIFSELEKRKLPYLPLKGYFLKRCYPSPDMRFMCDLDVLIRMDRYPEYDEILKELGYIFRTESAHELIYQKPPLMNIELHKSIVPNYETEYYAYYQDGWRFARQYPDRSECFLGEEDFLVFLIIHLAKHYRHEGIGMRHFIDIYLFRRQISGHFDHDYFQKQLSKLNMTAFYESVCEVLAVWFEHAPMTEKVAFMSQYIIESGTNGELHTRNAHANFFQQEAGGGRWGIVLKKNLQVLFPNLTIMKKRFPALEKCPFLYPVFCVWRILRGALFRRSKARDMFYQTNVGNDYQYDSIKAHFQMVGLMDQQKKERSE